MPLGRFLLRRSASSSNRGIPLEVVTSPEEATTTNNTDSKGRGRSKKRRSSRSRSKSKNKNNTTTTTSSRSGRSRSRSKSRNGRGSSVDSKSSARSSASGHTLRSKSPSRARIEQFMSEIRAHEEAVAKRREQASVTPPPPPPSAKDPKTKETPKKNSKKTPNSTKRKSTTTTSTPKTTTKKKNSPSAQNDNNNKSKKDDLKRQSSLRKSVSERGKRSIAADIMRSSDSSSGSPKMMNATTPSTSQKQQQQQRILRSASTERPRKETTAIFRLSASERGRSTTTKQQQRDRSRSISRERLSLFLADRSNEGSNPNLSLSEDGKLTVISMDDDSSCSSEESSIGSLSRFEQKPIAAKKKTTSGTTTTIPTVISPLARANSVIRGTAAATSGGNNNNKSPPTITPMIAPLSSNKRSTSLGGAGGTRTPIVRSIKKSNSSSSRDGLGSPPKPTFVPNPNEWHAAIKKRDWSEIEQLLQTYDRKRYSPEPGSPTTKKGKKLRVLKYLNKNSSSFKENGESAVEDEDETGFNNNMPLPPLLCVDNKGCTPLHLACKEFMPVKFLQKLLLLERDAAAVADADGRWPLHIAIIGNLTKPVLDKLIRADPTGLDRPDNMKKTPLAYAVLRAEHARDKALRYTWSSPTASSEQAAWQSRQVENWATVKFLLETLVTRRQSLSAKHESTVLLQAVDCSVPPSVLKVMLTLSDKVMQHNGKNLMTQLMPKMVRQQYPMSVYERVLAVCTPPLLSEETLVNGFRVAMIEHFHEGCTVNMRDDLDGTATSFRSEIMTAYQTAGGPGGISKACQEWWDELRFFIAVSSGNIKMPDTLPDEYALHAALTIPQSPSPLIECLIRMFPQSRYIKDPTTDGLPLHLACRYWGDSRLWTRTSDHQHQQEACQLLNLLLAGDFTLAWTRYRRRLPLHYAILSGKPQNFIQTLIAMDTRTANAKDLRTDLFPFQLAALPTNSVTKQRKDSSLNQIETIFALLKVNPTAVCPKLALGSGDPKGDVGAVARHVVNWCYSYKRGESDTGWFMDKKHVQVLRSAISNGEMSSSLKRWWGDLKRKIWNVYDRQNAGKTIAYMPRLDRYLLHAALYNGRTPPIVIELLLELYPDAVINRAPGTDRYPLHIAAAAPSYTPLPFESTISMSSALEMILLSYPDAIYDKSDGRTVLQIAVDSGKTHEEIRPLFQEDPEMLTVPSSATGLYPFQQIASIESSLPTHLLIRDKTSTVRWNERSTPENARLLRGIQVDYQRDKLSSIYEMLRAKPEVVEKCFA